MRQASRALLRACSRRRGLSSTAGEEGSLVWSQLQHEAQAALRTPAFSRFGMGKFLEREVLARASLADALSHLCGAKFEANDSETHVRYEELLRHAFTADPALPDAAAADLNRFLVVDPASEGVLGVFLFFKGFQAVQCARAANYFWREANGEGRMIAKLLQSEMADVYGVDIHPGARFGRGITIDHATGVVIGETAVIGDDVYLMHDVTLGATGKAPEHDRHPKIGDGCLLGAAATVLGNIEVGDRAIIAASAVVNKPVPPGYTAVGVPARLIPPKTG